MAVKDATHSHSADNVESFFVLAEERFGIAMNLENMAVTQYGNYYFNSLAKFGDIYVGVNEDGIYQLENDYSDAGQNIDSVFELVKTDFGTSRIKRIRSIYFGGEFSGPFTLSIKKDDEDDWNDFTVTPLYTGQRQTSAKVNIGRDIYGRYFTFRITNTTGYDFSIDHMQTIIIQTARKPR